MAISCGGFFSRVSLGVYLAVCGQAGLLHTSIAVALVLAATSLLSNLNIMQTYTNERIQVTKRSLSDKLCRLGLNNDFIVFLFVKVNDLMLYK